MPATAGGLVGVGHVKGRWILAWRVPAHADGRSLLLTRVEFHRDARSVRRRAMELARFAWAGELRISAPGSGDVYTDFAQVCRWAPGQDAAPERARTLWQHDVQLEEVAIRFRIAVRVAVEPAVAAGVLMLGEGAWLVRAAETLARRPEL